MAELLTTQCSRYGHPEFRLTYDPALVPVNSDVRWLAKWLEQTVAQGSKYSHGQNCQIGWMWTEFRDREDGDLSLWEPDMRHMPVVWSESVSNTLAHLRLQKDVVESVLEPGELLFPSLRDSAIVCSQLGRSAGIVMERSLCDGSDSGWFFGCRCDHDHNDPTELRRVSLYETVVCIAPRILPYLALPVGIVVGVGSESPVIYWNGNRLKFREESYLARVSQGCVTPSIRQNA